MLGFKRTLLQLHCDIYIYIHSKQCRFGVRSNIIPPLGWNYNGAKKTSLGMDTQISQLCVYIKKRQRSKRISPSLQYNSAFTRKIMNCRDVILACYRWKLCRTSSNGLYLRNWTRYRLKIWHWSVVASTCVLVTKNYGD